MKNNNLIDINTPLDKIKYCAIDLETTGTSFPVDDIIEIALVEYRVGEKIKTFHSLIKPKAEIKAPSQMIHGITQEHLENAPVFSEICHKIEEFTADSVLIGHSLTNLDLSFLNREMKRCGRKPVLNYTIDTYHIVPSLFGLRKGRGLVDTATIMGVKTENHHRALPDARMVMKIWIKILNRLLRHGYKRFSEIMDKNLIDSGYSEKGKEIINLAREYPYFKIVYQSPITGRTYRTVEPIGVRGKKLDAYCHLRKDFRSFYIDRILSLEPLSSL